LEGNWDDGLDQKDTANLATYFHTFLLSWHYVLPHFAPNEEIENNNDDYGCHIGYYNP
jgi:hypothetical protein